MRARGLSSPEAWGTWSDGAEVVLDFAGNLPQRFELSLDGYAFGPNVGETFRVVVGSEQRTFRLAKTRQTVSLRFETTGNEKVLRILVPRPTSPRSIGQGDDSRELGVALHELRITASSETQSP
jgi:hypothetical protein